MCIQPSCARRAACTRPLSGHNCIKGDLGRTLLVADAYPLAMLASPRPRFRTVAREATHSTSIRIDSVVDCCTALREDRCDDGGIADARTT